MFLSFIYVRVGLSLAFRLQERHVWFIFKFLSHKTCFWKWGWNGSERAFPCLYESLFLCILYSVPIFYWKFSEKLILNFLFFCFQVSEKKKNFSAEKGMTWIKEHWIFHLVPLYELLEQNYNAFEFPVPLPDSFCHFNRCLSVGWFFWEDDY